MTRRSRSKRNLRITKLQPRPLRSKKKSKNRKRKRKVIHLKSMIGRMQTLIRSLENSRWLMYRLLNKMRKKMTIKHYLKRRRMMSKSKLVVEVKRHRINLKRVNKLKRIPLIFLLGRTIRMLVRNVKS